MYNVREFGAVGDGIADDGPAFRAALSAAMPLGGGTIFVPKGRYRIASTVYIAGTFVEELQFVGEGIGRSFIIPALNDTGTANFSFNNLASLSHKHLQFTNNGMSGIRSLAVILANVAQWNIDSCQFIDCKSLLGTLYSLGKYFSVRNCIFDGGDTSDLNSGIITLNDGGALIENTWFVDSVTNGVAWISSRPSLPIEYGSPQVSTTISNCGFDEAGGAFAYICRPTGVGRARTITFKECTCLEQTNTPMIEINKCESFRMLGCAVEKRQSSPIVTLFDVSNTLIDRLLVNKLNQDFTGGDAIVTADSQCGHVQITESQIDVIESSAKTSQVVRSGVVSQSFLSTSIPTNRFVKIGSGGAFALADSFSSVMGVTRRGTAFASTPPLMMPAPSSIPNLSTWGIQLDLNPGAFFYFQFRNDGLPASGSNVLVNLTAATTATDVAAAFVSAINSKTGTSFHVAATNVGASITITATLEGSIYDRRFIQLSACFAGIGAWGLHNGSSSIEVGFLTGQIYTVEVDGVDAISIGDMLTLGSSGRASKTTSGNFLGRAISSTAAVVGNCVKFLYVPHGV